ncbi:MAG: hypothetical protein FD130_650 [Halothiobacillaceae bacterium]|nr:MAG: hypothetical protein FD130_650 [Halothiobacillaceae bacterium]
MNRYAWLGTLLLTLLLSMSGGLNAAEGGGKNDSPTPQSIDTQLQSLKKEVLKLNRDLFQLEEELLFPASTQVVVMLTVDASTLFNLDAVELKLDDKVVASHLYTEREAQALQRGGVQQLFMGNITTGQHELVALYTGKGPHDRAYRRGATVQIDKGLATKYIELKIVANAQKEQPDFVVKQW